MASKSFEQDLDRLVKESPPLTGLRESKLTINVGSSLVNCVQYQLSLDFDLVNKPELTHEQKLEKLTKYVLQTLKLRITPGCHIELMNYRFEPLSSIQQIIDDGCLLSLYIKDSSSQEPPAFGQHTSLLNPDGAPLPKKRGRKTNEEKRRMAEAALALAGQDPSHAMANGQREARDMLSSIEQLKTKILNRQGGQSAAQVSVEKPPDFMKKRDLKEYDNTLRGRILNDLNSTPGKVASTPARPSIATLNQMAHNLGAQGISLPLLPRKRGRPSKVQKMLEMQLMAKHQSIYGSIPTEAEVSPPATEARNRSESEPKQPKPPKPEKKEKTKESKKAREAVYEAAREAREAANAALRMGNPSKPQIKDLQTEDEDTTSTLPPEDKLKGGMTSMDRLEHQLYKEISDEMKASLTSPWDAQDDEQAKPQKPKKKHCKSLFGKSKGKDSKEGKKSDQKLKDSPDIIVVPQLNKQAIDPDADSAPKQLPPLKGREYVIPPYVDERIRVFRLSKKKKDDGYRLSLSGMEADGGNTPDQTLKTTRITQDRFESKVESLLTPKLAGKERSAALIDASGHHKDPNEPDGASLNRLTSSLLKPSLTQDQVSMVKKVLHLVKARWEEQAVPLIEQGNVELLAKMAEEVIRNGQDNPEQEQEGSRKLELIEIGLSTLNDYAKDRSLTTEEALRLQLDRRKVNFDGCWKTLYKLNSLRLAFSNHYISFPNLSEDPDEEFVADLQAKLQGESLNVSPLGNSRFCIASEKWPQLQFKLTYNDFSFKVE